MDIYERLSGLIDRLPNGQARIGLEAVKLHIGTAIKHLERGERDKDETAFTDAILRCNHAFEGSVKEAYRVLADKDPRHTTPAAIENFMKEGDVLRPKVLAQFENYRKEWRNPSTHDYLLDFDSNEALLAIVSVSVFAIVLCDQMRGRFAFLSASRSGGNLTDTGNKNIPLLERVKNAVIQFAVEAKAGRVEGYDFNMADADEALAGFLTGELATYGVTAAAGVILQVSQDEDNIDEDDYDWIDVLVETSSEKIAIETRRRSDWNETKVSSTGSMIQNWISKGSVSGGLVFLIDEDHDYGSNPSTFPNYADNVLVVG